MNMELAGRIAANLGCISIVAGTYVTWGLGAGLGALGIYLFLVGVGYHELAKEEDEEE